MADTMAPSCMELTFELAEARWKAPIARMKLAVARAAAAAQTTASRHSRVRTSQFVRGPARSTDGAGVPASRSGRAASGRAAAGAAATAGS